MLIEGEGSVYLLTIRRLGADAGWPSSNVGEMDAEQHAAPRPGLISS